MRDIDWDAQVWRDWQTHLRSPESTPSWPDYYQERCDTRIVGKFPDEPNLRSENESTEITVKPVIRATTRKERESSRYYTPVTDEVLRDRAEKAVEGSLTDEYNDVVSRRLQGRINKQETHIDELYEVVTTQGERITALEERLSAEQTVSKPEPTYSMTIDLSALDNDEDVEWVRDEVDILVEYLLKKKNARR